MLFKHLFYNMSVKDRLFLVKGDLYYLKSKILLKLAGFLDKIGLIELEELEDD